MKHLVKIHKVSLEHLKISFPKKLPLVQHQNICLGCNIPEEKFDIINLPLTSSVSESIKKFLEPEELTGAKRWFCPSCNDLTNSTEEIKFVKGELL